MNPDFNIIDAEIIGGSTLIEASAGTGKTEAIAGLFLRLVLQEVPVAKILVVTYTEAATAELRERVRGLLAEARESLNGGETKTPYLLPLLAKHAEEKIKAGPLLEAALRDFDCAAIFTIHGFCQRALRDNAFESQMLFDTELVTDERQLVQETIQDFWRKNFYENDAVLVHFALRYKTSPDDFFELVKKRLNYDAVKITARSGLSREKAAAALLERFADVKRLWSREKKNVMALIKASGWAKGDHKKQELVDAHFAALQACLECDEYSAETFECFTFFCSKSLKKNTAVKGTGTPQHEFFELCEELCARETDYVCALEVDCLHFVERELARRKKRRNVQFFHDLLSNLHHALASAGGKQLAQSLREKYKAALIDEFQDTDPLQYQIFRQIFSNDDNYLFLIGDPKQAIYGFRGADIFTYLKAAQAASRQFSLPTNYRSEGDLVHAVNTFFASAQAPFVFPEIEFKPVDAAGKADERPLTFSAKKEAPLQIWLWNDELGKSTRTNAEEILPELVAAEISRLLTAEAQIGDQKLKPKHFAVLVLENQQAQRMQRALSALNIPCVLQTNESLFATREAVECERVLRAIAEPADERRVRAALATDLLGQDAPALEKLSHDEQGAHECLSKFRDWFDLWASRGFIQMFRSLLLEENVRERLLRFPDGERRLTNILHLSETLHTAALEKKFGPQALLNWLASQMGAAGDASDENQLRLERDEEAVQLVTVHKSKGLQYPIVFCPFSWKGRSARNKSDHAWFHDENGELNLDLSSAELKQHQDIELKESIAERVRLLYVALTRARNRCYLVWGNFKDAETSAPAYVLHQPQGPAENMLDSVRNRFAEISEEQLISDLRRLVAASKNKSGFETIAISNLSRTSGARYCDQESIGDINLRKFAGRVEDNWKISSFSALTHGAPEEAPDFDALEAVAEDEIPGSGIFSFPRGAKAGVCLHQIFEKLDFAESNPQEIAKLVRLKLSENGFAPEHEDVLCENVGRVLSLPLNGAGLKFNQIKNSQRLNELEFHFPLNEISPANLHTIFSRHKVPVPELPGRLGKLTFNPVQGVMKGFIDLVFRAEEKFYIVDWKSNWLGNRLEDYGVEKLKGEMLRQHYLLQYHLYTLALHKFLQLRVRDYSYEKHFGGVFYIFLRGVDPARSGFGVFTDCPSADLISELDRQLIYK